MTQPSKINFFREDDKYGELSNFYNLVRQPLKSPSGYKCTTSEHLYQILKYDYPDAPTANHQICKMIEKSSTPYKAKIIANAVYNKNTNARYEWQRKLIAEVAKVSGAIPLNDFENKRLDVMRCVLECKFKTNEHCREVLLKTGDAVLVEQSPYDMYWGCGRDGRGENHLGLLLMETRANLRKTDNTEDEDA